LPLERAAWIILGLSATVFAAAAGFLGGGLGRAVFPQLEILPEGGVSRAQALWNKARSVSIELARPAWAAFLAALFFLLLVRLLD
jgi:hypothetical protein